MSGFTDLLGYSAIKPAGTKTIKSEGEAGASAGIGPMAMTDEIKRCYCYC